MNYKKLGEILGKIMILEGALMLAPLLVSLLYKESFTNILAFAIPIFIAIYSTAICLGSVISSSVIWDGADLSIGAMTVINVAILIKLSGEVKSETESYFGNKK